MGNALATRELILSKAFELIYKNGYQATSIDHIIATTKVTKGAFYYHFKSKEKMGLAVIHDVIYPRMFEALVVPLQRSTDPVNDVYQLMHKFLLANTTLSIAYGCPANNLVQEMAPVDPKFRKALSKLFHEWQQAIKETLARGKKKGIIRKDVQEQSVANFIIAGYGGVRNIGKIYQTSDCYKTYLQELKKYLQSLT
jgi:TetR/AcrR family transcriptional repressor of nem operon